VIGISSEVLRIWSWNVVLPKERGMSGLAVRLLTSLEALCFMHSCHPLFTVDCFEPRYKLVGSPCHWLKNCWLISSISYIFLAIGLFVIFLLTNFLIWATVIHQSFLSKWQLKQIWYGLHVRVKSTNILQADGLVRRFRAGVSKRRPSRLFYAASGRSCKLYIYFKKLHNNLYG
jgi:hypothetical protein